MTTDRQLLEDAARAIGIECIGPMGNDGLHLFNGKHWNPLTGDGDSACMESALSLNVEWQTQHVVVGRTSLDKWQEPYANHIGDKQAARRYASTRAAAAIGRQTREAE